MTATNMCSNFSGKCLSPPLKKLWPLYSLKKPYLYSLNWSRRQNLRMREDWFFFIASRGGGGGGGPALIYF